MFNKSNKIIFIILIVLMFTGILYVFLPKFFIKELSITYPFDGSLFPREIISPTFRWDDKNSGVDYWRIKIEFVDNNDPLIFNSKTMEWTPDDETWEFIKEKTLEKNAEITILGIGEFMVFRVVRSRNTVTIQTSLDVVGAPIFFREVPVPFDYARQHMDEIKWRLGDVSSKEPPKVVLENMPVCGNCHSFSADGSTIGMDIDYANDKGSYLITDFSENIMLTKDEIITWNDYRRQDNEETYGLLSQISPDGRYAVSTVKDRSVFVAIDDLYYSQLFFPIKGILAYYDTLTGSFHSLPGADDRNYVQSNPNWSPDGKYIVFAKSKIGELKDDTGGILVTQAQSQHYISRETLFRFDLNRIPFNESRGGKAEPLEGASNNGMSNYFAKYSPDGKWIVFCKAESFMLLQPDSNLYIMPAEGGQPRKMRCNTDNMNSWHSWSPNSKWLVFSSKAFGPYTKLLLTHIDEDGNDTPPILLSHFTNPERAANIPEFVNVEPGFVCRMYEQFIDNYSYVRLADNLVTYERYEEAVKKFKESIEINPNYAIAHRNLAEVLLRLDKPDEAEKEFEIALKLDRKDPVVHQNLGTIYMNRDEYDKAQKAFETAMKLDINYAPAIEGMGVLLYLKGDYNKAKEKLITALNINPELSNASFNLGKLYMINKEYDKAEKEFQTVVKIKSDPEAHIQLGIIHFINEKYYEAEEDFDAALEIDPDSAGALYNLGIIYMQREEFDKAEKAFLKVYRNNPNTPNVCFMLARLLSMNNSTIPDAIKMYDKTLSLMPSNLQAYIELGNLFLRIGRKEAAINEFEKALKLNPDAQELKAQINKLKQL